MAATQQQQSHWIERYLPIVQWGRTYDRSWLRGDVIAGITIAAFAIPENMAYASLAGLGPEIGIYASIAAMFAYTLFGTSKQMAVGVTSALSIMVAGTLGTLALADADDYLAAAGFVAIAAGVIAILAGVFRLGFVVNFISESVLKGFSAGAALFIASSQIAKLFGIEGVDGNFFERIWNVIRNLGETSGWTLALGLASLALLVGMERFIPKLPAALIVVVLAIVVMWLSDLDERGVAITGEIPQGLPVPTIPWVDASLIPALTSLAFGCFLLSYVEGIGVARTFAARYKYPIDANQELIANGAMNLVSGVFRGYVTGGSMSRSAVNDEAGAKTPLVGAVAAAIMVVVLLFLTGPFKYLPETTLAAVVLVAVRGLIDVPALRRLYDVSKGEFLAAMGAFAGVLVFGMLEGIIIGVLVSFLTLLRRAASPHTTELGYVPEGDVFVGLETHAESTRIPGVLLFRADAGLFYANAPVVKDRLMALIDASETPIEMVVFDLAATPTIDLGAAEVLEELREDLDARGIKLRLFSAYQGVREMIRKAGHKELVLDIDLDTSPREMIERWKARGDGGASGTSPTNGATRDDA